MADDDNDDDANARRQKALLAAHVACFQSVCRKRREAKRRAAIEFESFDATANIVVAKARVKKRDDDDEDIEKKEEVEEEEEEEGKLTLMFPVRAGRWTRLRSSLLEREREGKIFFFVSFFSLSLYESLVT